MLRSILFVMVLALVQPALAVSEYYENPALRVACENLAPVLWREYQDEGRRLRRRARELRQSIAKERDRLKAHVDQWGSARTLFYRYVELARSGSGGYRCDAVTRDEDWGFTYTTCTRRLEDGAIARLRLSYPLREPSTRPGSELVTLGFAASHLEEYPERRMGEGKFLSLEAVTTEGLGFELKDTAFFKVRDDASLGTLHIDGYSNQEEFMDPSSNVTMGDETTPALMSEYRNMNFAHYVDLLHPECSIFLYGFGEDLLHTRVLLNGLNISSDEEVRFMPEEGQSSEDEQCLVETAGVAQ